MQFRHRVISQTVFLGAFGLGSLVACQTPNTLQSQEGRLKFSVQWPEKSNKFQIKAIPENTQKIIILIQGANLPQAISETLVRDPGETQDKALFNLPTGPKTVKVTALGGQGEVLALDVQTVDIQGGQNHQLTMDLAPTGAPTPLPSNLVSLAPDGSLIPSANNSSDNNASALLPLPPNPTNTFDPIASPDNTAQNTQAENTSIAPASTEVTGLNTGPSNITSSSGGGSSGGGSSGGGSSSSSPSISAVTPANAFVGENIVIAGDNLSKINTVLFNGIAANFTIIDDGKLETTVPSGATSGSITLSTGSSSAVYSGFTVDTEVENLVVYEVFFANISANNGKQYIQIKNTGATQVNAGGLNLYYTGKSGNLKQFVIPANKFLNPGQILTVVINQSGTNTTAEIFTGTSNFEELLIDSGATTEIALCKSAPCSSSNFLSYMAYGSGTGSLASAAQSAGIWDLSSFSLSNVTTNIVAGTTVPNQIRVTSVSPFGSLAVNDSVIMQLPNGLRVKGEYNSTITTPDTVILNLGIGTSIQSTNSDDGTANGYLVNDSKFFQASDRIYIRGQLTKTLDSVLGSTRLKLASTDYISNLVHSINYGSGIESPIVLLSTSPFVTQSNDLVRLKTNTTGTAGNNILRTVTSAINLSNPQISINSAFSTLPFALNQLGTGASTPITMSSLPSGFGVGQTWGGGGGLAFEVTNSSGNNVTFNQDLSACPISSGNTGTSSIDISGPCTGVELEIGDRVVVNGTSFTIAYMTVAGFGWPDVTQITLDGNLATAPTSGSIFGSPSGGNMELVPKAGIDKLITIPRGGSIEILPESGQVMLQKALRFSGSTPPYSQSNYNLADPSL